MQSHRENPDSPEMAKAASENNRYAGALALQAAYAFHYSMRVDRHVYGIRDGCQTREDWIALAIAALDQAGFSTDKQEEIMELL